MKPDSLLERLKYDELLRMQRRDPRKNELQQEVEPAPIEILHERVPLRIQRQKLEHAFWLMTQYGAWPMDRRPCIKEPPESKVSVDLSLERVEAGAH